MTVMGNCLCQALPQYYINTNYFTSKNILVCAFIFLFECHAWTGDAHDAINLFEGDQVLARKDPSCNSLKSHSPVITAWHWYTRWWWSSVTHHHLACPTHLLTPVKGYFVMSSVQLYPTDVMSWSATVRLSISWSSLLLDYHLVWRDPALSVRCGS